MDSSATSRTDSDIRALQQRRDELQCRLDRDKLRKENEVLESQVLFKQEEFGHLQEEFKEMKERFGEQLRSLDRQLETQQGVTTAAQKRTICTEDLIRFFDEQRRLMAGHWKSQCQLKDERIRALNLQLTEYTIDWQRLGTQKQTEASLTHEFQCLQDRHSELQIEHSRRRERWEELAEQLSEVKAAEATEANQAENCGLYIAPNSPRSRVRELEASGAGLRCQLQLLEEWRRSREVRRQCEAQKPEISWPHSCIWRDELDVRERQLEKITSQLDKTNSALHAAQAALASQRLRHEDMKQRHREAESELREDERIRTRWRKERYDLQQCESNLRRAVETLRFQQPQLRAET